MTVKKLLRMGDQRLLEKSITVQNIDSPEVQQLIDDLWESQDFYGGAGIAAPQIGSFQRVVVFGFKAHARYPHEKPIADTVLINPEIEVLDDALEEDWEGCLSVPLYRGLVPRYKKIGYRGYDRDGQLFEREAAGFHARLVQHECDHLDGVLFPMRIKDLRNFGCEDLLWQRMNTEAYPEEYQEALPESWK
ncbi:MAG: peptide deformylase [Coxiella sp. (in: Bacteria)]|nr:MAG: peptide deformylase [Coxiella sp. (in: g-proteobacteria)]